MMSETLLRVLVKVGRCCDRAMYGLLQLLPQSDAFRTLHARLHAAPTAALLQLSPPHSSTGNGMPGKSPAEVRVMQCPNSGACHLMQCVAHPCELTGVKSQLM